MHKFIAGQLGPPTVATNPATNLTTSEATFNGEVTSDGGDTVIERGFVYAASPDPAIDGGV